MSNPFDLLGNDVEDSAIVAPPTREIVKNYTSSKKADVPPPNANPARANKNRPRPTGNEAAIRDKAAGREKNRSRDVPASSTARRQNIRRQTDRHSRTGKTDSEKKVKQGWGDDKKEAEFEAEAEADAKTEIATSETKEEVAEPPVDNRMTLEAYLASQQPTNLNKVSESRTINKLEYAQVVVKEQEVYVPATKVKTVKSKQLKTKKFLDFDATFPDSHPRGRRGGNYNNGGRRGGRNDRKAPQNSVQKNREIDTSNLPSLA